MSSDLPPGEPLIPRGAPPLRAAAPVPPPPLTPPTVPPFTAPPLSPPPPAPPSVPPFTALPAKPPASTPPPRLPASIPPPPREEEEELPPALGECADALLQAAVFTRFGGGGAKGGAGAWAPSADAYAPRCVIDTPLARFASIAGLAGRATRWLPGAAGLTLDFVRVGLAPGGGRLQTLEADVTVTVAPPGTALAGSLLAAKRAASRRWGLPLRLTVVLTLDAKGRIVRQVERIHNVPPLPWLARFALGLAAPLLGALAEP
jgi:hypothetical protein